MADKTIGSIKIVEISGCCINIHYIFPDGIPRAAVGQRDLIDFRLW